MDFSQALAAGPEGIIRKQYEILVANLGFASRPRSRGFEHLSGKPTNQELVLAAIPDAKVYLMLSRQL